MPGQSLPETSKLAEQQALEAMFDKMPGGKAFSKIAKNDFLTKAIDLLTGTTNPQLDQARKVLEEEIMKIQTQLQALKEDVEGSVKLEGLAINLLPEMWEKFQAALKKDFFEANITDENKITEVIAAIKVKFDESIIQMIQNAVSEIPQQDMIASFITDVTNFDPELSAAINSAEPQLKILSWLDEKLSLMPESVQKLFGGKKEMKIQAVATIASMGLLPPAVSKTLKEYVKNQKEADTGATTPETAPEISDEQKVAIDAFRRAGFEMDLAKTEEDWNFLKSQSVDIAILTDRATAPNSNLNRINNEIKKLIGDGKLRWRMRYAYVLDNEQLTEGQIVAITENVKILQQSPETVRTYLDNACKVKKGEDTAQTVAVLDLEKLKKTA